MTAAVANPANFALSDYFTIDRATTGRDLGAALDFSDLWRQGDQGWGSTLNFGAKVIDERKRHASTGGFWFTGNPLALTPMLSGFSDPNYYSNVTNTFTLGPMPDEALARAYEDAHARGRFHERNQHCRQHSRELQRLAKGSTQDTRATGRLLVHSSSISDCGRSTPRRTTPVMR